MAKFLTAINKSFTKDAPKRLTLGNRQLNEWIAATILFIVVLVPVHADLVSVIENVNRISDEFLRFEIIKPTLHHGSNNKIISDTRLEDGDHVKNLILHYVNGDQGDVILDLKLNHNLLPHQHFMRYQLPNGTDAVQHFTKTDTYFCHYIGTIRNNSGSHVAISTCYGVKGVIFDGNETYYIETKHNGNIIDEHYLYRHSDKIQSQSNHSNCGTPNHETIEALPLNVEHRMHKRSTDRVIRAPSNANRESSFVELVLVVDNSVYISFGRDFKKNHHYCKEIANNLNAVYVPLNIFIILVGVSVWNERDRIHLSKDSTETLENFLQHRREVLMLEHPNDNAHLLTNQKFERSVIGHARVNTICSFKSSGGISNVHSPSASIVATTVAHELGHNFGMHHDTECEKPPCIMEYASSSSPSLQWSSCSKNQLDIALQRGLLQCLRNKPSESSINAICGNGFVEPGEECDCGLPKYCKNSCCDANTCRLRPNATCATGECCDLTTCRLLTKGTLCRPAEGDCDISEYCTETSEYCPENRFKRDTELCGNGKAYCYEGACQSHNDQCKLLWGEHGETVDQCYLNNLKGDTRGNCGKNWMKNTFKKCFEEDMMCGQLQCKPSYDSNELEKSSRVEIMRSYSLVYPYQRCQSAIVDVGLYNVDPGLTPNGAICGKGKMCLDQKCVSIDSLRASGIGVDCPENCNGHGVCDNKGKCHCDAGYEPPLCKLTSPKVQCPENCSGHGLCDNKGKCHCDAGFEPPLCKLSSPKVQCPENCSGHGLCDNKGKCYCDAGYEPPLCKLSSPKVQCPENCSGHGLCDNKGKCYCDAGYEPPLCKLSSPKVQCPENCSGHGLCDNEGKCHCDAGYEPPLCKLSSPKVQCPENCSWHGLCDNKGKCYCDAGYEPPLCKLSSPKVQCPENCSGHGLCDNKGKCYCDAGYEPPLCKLSSPKVQCPENCSGHGLCDNKGKCYCDAGYEPPLCKLSSPKVQCPENCSGHGLCVNKGKCYCDAGYEPPLCKLSSPKVQCPENCSGHGLCDNEGKCHCDAGYEPPLCKLSSPKVQCPENCSGHGLCDNEGKCHCDAGYEPPLCKLSSPKVQCPENCSGHGLCDNKGKCHCEAGYEPPLCNLTTLEWAVISDEPIIYLNSHFIIICNIFILLLVIIIFTLYMRIEFYEYDGQELLMGVQYEDIM